MIFERHVSRLVALARSRLDVRIRGKEDPEDVVQSAFRSFFARFADGQFKFDNWNNVWTMLAVVTLRKCGHHVQHYRAACRDVRREAVPMLSSDESVASWQTIAREPSPSDALKLSETVEQHMKGFDEREKKMVLLKLEGHSSSEIAAQVGRTDRTVRLVLERFRRRLVRSRDE